ncbi:MmcQ/YjbR family DNA-binding protein [Paenibacillus sp. J2TS4]|uniref:MmcQ/YjbR family DNA-binding protein n=1 Tax=Paenibacillus sp. J2TS4 TaxID=2807194 RepID=UPI001B220E34|nr:MmcQ/YjbR family DNA-binding protein [Paenibacillus sp. J2TS4]GIP31476.1 hypothetical protein J2TS4_06860 [Paenibacillus sp. J2TS4]
MKEWIQYGLSKKGAFSDYPFGPQPLVLKVGSKMFALINEEERSGSISLKCDPEMAYLLRQQHPSVKPGYHLNKQHWNTVIVDGTVPEEELKWMMDHSYELVVKGLKKSEARELGLI